MAVGFSRPMLALGLFFAILWSLVVVIRSLTRICKIGRTSYFFVKNRTTVPEELTDPELGKHGYLQLRNVSRKIIRVYLM